MDERKTTHVEDVVEDVVDEDANAEIHAKTYILAVNMVYVAQLVSVVGSGSLGHNIAAATGASEQRVWLTSPITILTAALSAPVSQAADYWGRKWLLIFFTCLGCIGSIMVSRANTPTSIIAGFVVSGLGFGAQPLIATISSEVLPRRMRPYAQGFFCTAGALSALVSLVFGGALVRNGNNEGFRVYYYICAGVFALSALLSAFLYNPPPRSDQRELKCRDKLGALDWPAYILLTLGIILFCVGLSWSQNPYPWSDPHVSAPFAVGVCLLIALIFYAWFVKVDGILHHKLFHDRNFSIALACQFVEGFCFFASNNYWPAETLKFLTSDPLVIGANYGVCFVAGIVVAAAGATYSWKTKLLRPPCILAFVLFIVFNVLSATVTTDTPASNFWGYPVFSGAGMGLCLANVMTVAQFATPSELISTTTGLVVAVRNIGGTVSLAVLDAVYNHGITSNMASKVAAATEPLGLPASSLGPLVDALMSTNSQSLSTVPGLTSEITAAAEAALQETYVIAYRYVWVTSGAFSAVALVATFFIVEQQAVFNAHVDAPVERQVHASTSVEKI